MTEFRQWNQPFLLESCAANLSCSYILNIKEIFELQVQITGRFEVAFEPRRNLLL